MRSRRRLRSVSTAALLMSMCAALNASAAEPVDAVKNACATPPHVGGRSTQLYNSTPLLLVADELEAQGEANFHLRYAVPAAECVVETYDVPERRITASYNPFEKGLSTLNYRFTIARPSDRTEILLLFSGTASLVAGRAYVFHVSEEKDGVISWYAMFREPPDYPVVKNLVQQIVSARAKPLLAVRWPRGAKEGDIVVFDSRRLKNY